MYFKYQCFVISASAFHTVSEEFVEIAVIWGFLMNFILFEMMENHLKGHIYEQW